MNASKGDIVNLCVCVCLVFVPVKPCAVVRLECIQEAMKSYGHSKRWKVDGVYQVMLACACENAGTMQCCSAMVNQPSMIEDKQCHTVWEKGRERWRGGAGGGGGAQTALSMLVMSA